MTHRDIIISNKI